MHFGIYQNICIFSISYFLHAVLDNDLAHSTWLLPGIDDSEICQFAALKWFKWTTIFFLLLL